MTHQKYQEIKKTFKSNKGYARTRDLLAQGVHPRDIKGMVDAGTISKVKNGLYRLSDVSVVSHQSFIDIARAVPEGVICLLSALSYYQLTTFNPSVVSVAIYRKAWRPKIMYPPVEFYYFSTKQFQSGIDTITIEGQKIRIYSPEKTLCDCFRYRNKLGLDIAKEALTEYLKWKKRNIEKLLEFSAVCRVKPILQTWLSALV
jgi:predicted transcriptional regulator of viral defense system